MARILRFAVFLVIKLYIQKSESNDMARIAFLCLMQMQGVKIVLISNESQV